MRSRRIERNEHPEGYTAMIEHRRARARRPLGIDTPNIHLENLERSGLKRMATHSPP